MPVKITSSFKPFLISSKVKGLQNTQLIGTRRNFSILCGGATVGIVFTYPSQAAKLEHAETEHGRRGSAGIREPWQTVLCVFSIRHCTFTTPISPPLVGVSVQPQYANY